MAAHGLKLGQHARPIRSDPLLKLAQEEEIGDAAHLLLGPLGGVETGTNAAPGVSVATWHQRRLFARPGAGNDLAKPLLVVEPHGEQDVADDGEKLRSLRQRRFAAHQEIAQIIAALEMRTAHRRGPDTAGLAVNALHQPNVILVGSTQFGQRPGEEGRKGQQVGRQGAQVEGQVEVNNPVGE